MGFHNARELKKLERQWAYEREYFLAEGLIAEAIDALHDEDKRQYNRDRRFHNNSICSLERTRPKAPATYQMESITSERYGWIEVLEHDELAEAIKMLPPADIELLKRLFVDRDTAAEIARDCGVTRQAVSKRVARLKRHLINHCPDLLHG